MGELVFVGLGLSGVRDMTLNALSAISECDEVFAEFYTSSLLDCDEKELESALGKEVIVLDRKKVEETDFLIERAMKRRVAFLVAGDPMTATTHVDLRLRAHGRGIPTRIVHGVSILTACASALGLQPYKFGRTVTIPFPEPGYFPSSPYDNIADNKERGLHTLVLLDIRGEEGRYMTSAEAISWLMEAESKWRRDVINDGTLICAAARIGSPSQKLRADYPSRLIREEMGDPLHTVVIPGRLHFMEARSLVAFAGAPEEILNE